MRNIFISTCVFTLIYGIDSSIRMEKTIPQHPTPENAFYPALILRNRIFLKNEPAVPHDIVIKNDIQRFSFERFDVGIEALNNLNISYVCPKENNPEEVEYSKTTKCKKALQITTSTSLNRTCGGGKNSFRVYTYIGYGLENELGIFSCAISPDSETKKVEYPLYKLCFDEEERLAYHGKYILRSKNELYFESDKIYPEDQLKEIFELELDYRKKIADKFQIQHVLLYEEGGPWDPKESHLIAFQLVSHKDMILYNWKMATFHEKNYSLIWSNIANTAWRKINDYLREMMKKSNCDISVYSGVHKISKDNYPLYIWKFVRSYMKGIAIIIHNHRLDDPEDYPHICEYRDNEVGTNNCERYGLYANEKRKDYGYTYCCTTKKLGQQIPYFKDRFTEIQPLETGHLCDNSIPSTSYKFEEEPNLPSSHVIDTQMSSVEENAEPGPSQEHPEVEKSSRPTKPILNTPSFVKKVELVRTGLLEDADPEFFTKDEEIRAH